MVFDCGTGARALGRELLASGQTDITILFSHTHMDHLFALPFFAPVLSPRCRVTLGVPAQSKVQARSKIGWYLNGTINPLRFDDLAATVDVIAVQPATAFSVGPYSVQTMRLVHPGGTVGYRVSHGGRSICYLTDTGPMASPDQGLMAGEAPTERERELLDFVEAADLMVIDTTFTQDEYLEKMTWGHGYPEYAVQVATCANVKQVALYHHSPDATDADLDVIAQRWEEQEQPVVFPAKEGMVVDLSG